MKISREDVLKVAALANLELSDAEVDTYRGHLDDILTYIDKLNEIDTSGRRAADASGCSVDG